ncbi:MAG TPA: hypothetical protein VLL97_09830 [Acidobacteriota bacterium]|nr:hypothetical protein [Acidobacteriota bacterium]
MIIISFIFCMMLLANILPSDAEEPDMGIVQFEIQYEGHILPLPDYVTFIIDNGQRMVPVYLENEFEIPRSAYNAQRVDLILDVYNDKHNLNDIIHIKALDHEFFTARKWTLIIADNENGFSETESIHHMFPVSKQSNVKSDCIIFFDSRVVYYPNCRSPRRLQFPSPAYRLSAAEKQAKGIVRFEIQYNLKQLSLPDYVTFIIDNQPMEIPVRGNSFEVPRAVFNAQHVDFIVYVKDDSFLIDDKILLNRLSRESLKSGYWNLKLADNRFGFDINEDYEYAFPGMNDSNVSESCIISFGSWSGYFPKCRSKRLQATE